jgi:hypothetical protein
VGGFGGEKPLAQLGRRVVIASEDVVQDAVEGVVHENWAVAELGRGEFERSPGGGVRGHAVTKLSVAITPHGDPNRSEQLSNLGKILFARYERTGHESDLDEAVEVSRAAAVATYVDGPNRAKWLKNLSIVLRVRFERTGCRADLDEAVKASREALVMVVVAALP